MNKWIRRILGVLFFPLRVAICLIAVLLILGFDVQAVRKERVQGPVMVTGHSSCAIAIQKWKARAEKHHGQMCEL